MSDSRLTFESHRDITRSRRLGKVLSSEEKFSSTVKVFFLALFHENPSNSLKQSVTPTFELSIEWRLSSRDILLYPNTRSKIRLSTIADSMSRHLSDPWRPQPAVRAIKKAQRAFESLLISCEGFDAASTSPSPGRLGGIRFCYGYPKLRTSASTSEVSPGDQCHVSQQEFGLRW